MPSQPVNNKHPSQTNNKHKRIRKPSLIQQQHSLKFAEPETSTSIPEL